MATLATQVISLAGTNPTFANATAGGDKCEVGERLWLHVKNGSASAVTVTVTATSSQRGLATSNLTVSVPASGERTFGPIFADTFQNQSDGLAAIGYSAAASVTVAAFRI